MILEVRRIERNGKEYTRTLEYIDGVDGAKVIYVDNDFTLFEVDFGDGYDTLYELPSCDDSTTITLFTNLGKSMGILYDDSIKQNFKSK